MNNDKIIKRGIVYAATHEKYVLEAINSYSSVLEHYDVPSVIYLNKDIDLKDKTLQRCKQLFSNVVYLDEYIRKYVIKIHAIKESPYDHTLFLDGDTYICGSIEPLFELLNYFDMGACLDNNTYHNYPKDKYAPHLENVQIEYNTGVLLFNKKNDNTNLFIDLWLTVAKELLSISYMDQLSFRDTLIRCKNIKLSSIPNNWNFKGSNSGMVTAGPIFIIHERFGTRWDNGNVSYSLNNHKMKKIAHRFNKSQIKRIIIRPFVIPYNLTPINIMRSIKRKLGLRRKYKKVNMFPETEL
jgi:hypothetical protein